MCGYFNSIDIYFKCGATATSQTVFLNTFLTPVENVVNKL